jgi:hypothetical protein
VNSGLFVLGLALAVVAFFYPQSPVFSIDQFLVVGISGGILGIALMTMAPHRFVERSLEKRYALEVPSIRQLTDLVEMRIYLIIAAGMGGVAVLRLLAIWPPLMVMALILGLLIFSVILIYWILLDFNTLSQRINWVSDYFAMRLEFGVKPLSMVPRKMVDNVEEALVTNNWVKIQLSVLQLREYHYQSYRLITDFIREINAHLKNPIVETPDDWLIHRVGLILNEFQTFKTIVLEMRKQGSRIYETADPTLFDDIIEFPDKIDYETLPKSYTEISKRIMQLHDNLFQLVQDARVEE